MRASKVGSILTNEFSRFGVVYNRESRPADDENENFEWRSPYERLEAGEYTLSMLTCKKRDLLVKEMERHLQTVEVMIALDDDVYIPVGEPGDEWDGKISVFLVPRGSGIVLNKGVRHFIPYTLNHDCNCTIIYKANTAEGDLELEALDEPCRIEA